MDMDKLLKAVTLPMEKAVECANLPLFKEKRRQTGSSSSGGRAGHLPISVSVVRFPVVCMSEFPWTRCHLVAVSLVSECVCVSS